MRDLTKKERRTLVLTAKGYTTRQIALREGVGSPTIADRKARSYRVLGVGSAIEAVVLLLTTDKEFLADVLREE